MDLHAWLHGRCVALSADGATLVSGSRDTTLMVWPLAVGSRSPLPEKPRHVLHGHDDEARTAAFLRDFRPDNYSYYRRAGHLYAKKDLIQRGRTGAGGRGDGAAVSQRL